jgi:hypothetical protein
MLVSEFRNKMIWQKKDTNTVKEMNLKKVTERVGSGQGDGYVG